MTVRLVICDTCAKVGEMPRGADWAPGVRAAFADQNLDIDVVTTSCLNVCDDPLTFALQGDGRATYVFSGALPDQDIDDLCGLARLYLDAPEGWITDARKAGRLRDCLVARVPVLKP